MAASSLLARVGGALRRAWDALDYVPDCPVCHGSGEPQPGRMGWAVTVWWKGRQEVVCDNCEGSGKV